MPQYSVDFQTVVTVTIPIEAATPEDAVDAAYDHLPTLSAEASGMFSDGAWSRDEGEFEAFAVYQDSKEVWRNGLTFTTAARRDGGPSGE